MKTKLLFLVLLISNLNFAQYTAIPDPNFENALSANDDIPNDGQVPTANINTITGLDVSYQSIADLTGIEDFTALTDLICKHNPLNNLDLSQNTNLSRLECYNDRLSNLDLSHNINLSRLECYNNQLTSLDFSQNTNLSGLDCHNNRLSNLDLSHNIYLRVLHCYNNQLTHLDISNNINIVEIYCFHNQLTSLDVKNGHNTSIRSSSFTAANNPNLTCIEVDNVTYSTTNWTHIDPQTSFSTDCAASVDESALNEAITIYPNPVNHILNISAQDPIEKLSIYNVTGQEVMNKQSNATEVQVDMNHLQRGIYFVKVQINGQVKTFKVVKE